ncbi:hypothetical protein ACFYKX_14810 [Cytobacillus sp. FJAT-54145]|uniref:Sporulation protein n=1 Tax=Cytobacillus spartinae TaxID=3299023 RepID=A0ABW6KCH3_9BACI
MKKLYSFFCLSFLLLAGCAQNENADGWFDNNQDVSGKDFIQNKNVGFEDDYSMGRTMSDQNPNFPDFDGNRMDQQEYVDKIRTVINDTGKYEADAVWFNGNHVWVTAVKKGELSRRDRINAEAELHKILMKAVPGFDLEVKVEEDRS